MAGKKSKQALDAPEILELQYQLAELPSSQHRAGLAGLCLMVDWLNLQPNRKGICEVERTAYGASLRINQQGLAELFDEIYAASLEEQERPQPLKNGRTKAVIPPLREETRQSLDPKTGKVKEKTVYIYESVIPRGGLLLSNDPTADGRNGAWIKLWRDVIWSIFRGVPATRAPFDDRAQGNPPTDALDIWQDLIQQPDHVVPLPSTYFIGAQANNAENVPFKDRARHQFLLHFWPYTAQIYVPAVINNEGDREFVGYALAIPDIANLAIYCEEFLPLLRGRGKELSGYRPRDCVVDLAIESALDTFRRLRDRLRMREGEASTSDLLLGVDIVHVDKQGNNIRLLGCTRVDPEAEMIDQYAQFRDSLWSPLFRRQRLLNLFNHSSWHAGFDGLMSKLPYEQTIGNSYFRRDARESFSFEVKAMNQQTNGSIDEAEGNDLSLQEDVNQEALIYRVVGNYLRFKLKSKHQLEWKDAWRGAKDNKPSELKEYEEKKTKLAREAFLAIRSRTGQDFIDYFVSTLCSVSQGMNERRFIALTHALVNETDNVRTLTMLALAAQTPNPQKTTAA
ncbi:MAG: type I-MYXAN CRISPR-associated protein Cmx8 [Blastocatellia bacterium]|nr:type I-MYXAN CRISPR-associated protein Cmx8 [Blastocatellia bacterium]